MTAPRGAVPSPPEALTDRYADWRWTEVSSYPPDRVTYRLTSDSGTDHFLKLARPGVHPSLAAEVERTVWAGGHLPVPRVLDRGSDIGVSWLLTEGLGGDDATDDRWSGDPRRLVRSLGEGLRRFHEAPAVECPFDFRLDAALAQVGRRVDEGLVSPDEDFHAEFAHLSADDALKRLEATRPREESLVVCHGDYCAPNILIQDWRAVGFVDLGELGVADRWWDLAVATWSVEWNFGPGLQEVLLAAYGIERDPKRIAFYRLLYDVVS